MHDTKNFKRLGRERGPDLLGLRSCPDRGLRSWDNFENKVLGTTFEIVNVPTSEAVVVQIASQLILLPGTCRKKCFFFAITEKVFI